jgi:hypothetical protein
MTTDAQVTFNGFARTAWRDAFSAMRRMPFVFGIAFVVMIAMTFAQAILVPVSSEKALNMSLTEQLWLLVVTVIQAFLLTPMLIAVHRYVLLGEITGRYKLNPFNSRFRRFFLFALALHLIFDALFFASQNFPPSFSHGKGIMLLLAFVCGMVAFVRLLVIFPAAAVDAPHANWRNAWRDSEGHGWSIFLVLLLVMLPFLAITVAVAFILTFVGFMGKLPILLTMFLLQPISTVAVLAADAAAASRIYRILGNHLGSFPRAIPASAPG